MDAFNAHLQSLSPFTQGVIGFVVFLIVLGIITNIGSIMSMFGTILIIAAVGAVVGAIGIAILYAVLEIAQINDGTFMEFISNIYVLGAAWVGGTFLTFSAIGS